MKTKVLPILFCLLTLFGANLACAYGRQDRTFEHSEFRFEIPSGWQQMAELWGSYELQKDYYKLGVEELAALTSVRKRGEFGIWFSVAKKPLGGEALETVVQNTYSPLLSQVADFTQSTAQVAGQTAIALRYRRPWGEPWWEFYDLWVEKDGFAYLLSFHAGSLDQYRAEIDLIRESFSFQP